MRDMECREIPNSFPEQQVDSELDGATRGEQYAALRTAFVDLLPDGASAARPFCPALPLWLEVNVQTMGFVNLVGIHCVCHPLGQSAYARTCDLGFDQASIWHQELMLYPSVGRSRTDHVRKSHCARDIQRLAAIR